MSAFDYFEQTIRSRIQPLSEIQPREPADPHRLERALAKMALAKSGAIPKRAPIRVVRDTSGSYRVIDGNTTYHALIQLGEGHAVVEEEGRGCSGDRALHRS